MAAYPKGVVEWGSVGYKTAKKLIKKLANEKPLIGRPFEFRMWQLFDSIRPLAISAAPVLLSLKRGSSRGRKYQIDVYAEFPGVLICVECKGGVNNDIKQDLRRIASEKKAVQREIKKIRGWREKIILHVLAYKAQTPSNQDYHDANMQGIIIWDERHLDFYKKLADNLKEAAQEIIFSDLLKGQKIPYRGSETIEVVALKTYHKGVSSYSMALAPSLLKRICYVNRRGLQYSSDFGTHYQRTIKPGKLRNIREFIKKGGSFPTSVLINFPRPLKEELITGKLKKKTQGNAENVIVTLPAIHGSAVVIDGQHRIFGYSGLETESKNHVLNVIAFGALPEREQVQMFVDINEQQTPVDPAVMCDLYTEVYPESDINHCISRTIKVLNKDGPLRNKIYIPSISKVSRFGYSLYINNIAVALSKSKAIYDNICDSTDGKKYTAIIAAFVGELGTQEKIRENMHGKGTFLASNNGMYAVLRTLSRFSDYIAADYHNLNKVNKSTLITRVREYANSISRGILSIGLTNLADEKRKSSESSKDSLANRIIVEAAKFDSRMKKISDDIYLNSIEEDLFNEFKESLVTGRDGSADDAYFTDEILGTVCAFINAGEKGHSGTLWVGIDDSGKKIGIDSELEGRFKGNFDKMKRSIQDQMKEKIKVKGGFNIEKDVQISIFSSNPTILSIVVTPDDKSVALVRTSKDFFEGFIKRSARKTKIKMENAELEFGDSNRANLFKSLFAEQMELLHRTKNK